MAWEEFLQSDFYIRMIIYGCLAYVGETFFTGIMDLIAPKFLCSWNVHGNQKPTQEVPQWRDLLDKRLVGYSFLWMAPVYALLVFIEPLTYYLQDLHLITRGCIYAIIIMIVEYLFGALLKAFTGKCPWDYSYHPLSIRGYTRWDFFFVWFIASLGVEAIVPKFIWLTPYIKQAFS